MLYGKRSLAQTISSLEEALEAYRSHTSEENAQNITSALQELSSQYRRNESLASAFERIAKERPDIYAQLSSAYVHATGDSFSLRKLPLDQHTLHPKEKNRMRQALAALIAGITLSGCLGKGNADPGEESIVDNTTWYIDTSNTTEERSQEVSVISGELTYANPLSKDGDPLPDTHPFETDGKDDVVVLRNSTYQGKTYSFSPEVLENITATLASQGIHIHFIYGEPVPLTNERVLVNLHQGLILNGMEPEQKGNMTQIVAVPHIDSYDEYTTQEAEAYTSYVHNLVLINTEKPYPSEVSSEERGKGTLKQIIHEYFHSKELDRGNEHKNPDGSWKDKNDIMYHTASQSTTTQFNEEQLAAIFRWLADPVNIYEELAHTA